MELKVVKWYAGAVDVNCAGIHYMELKGKHVYAVILRILERIHYMELKVRLEPE